MKLTLRVEIETSDKLWLPEVDNVRYLVLAALERLPEVVSVTATADEGDT